RRRPVRRHHRAADPAPAAGRGARAGAGHAGPVLHGGRRLSHGVDGRSRSGGDAQDPAWCDLRAGPRLSHVSSLHQPDRDHLRRLAVGAARPDAPRRHDPSRCRRSVHGARRGHSGLAPLHDRLLPGRVARRVCRRHGRADPLRLSGTRPGDAAAGARRRHPGRKRQPARLVRRQLRRRLPLQLRPGAVPRGGVRRALPADAHRPRVATPGSLRTGDSVKRAAVAAAFAILAAVPLLVGSTYYVNIASQILLYATFALGVNVLVGYAGLVSLGHAGLFGIAAYTGARLLTDGHGHLWVVTGALAMTLVAGVVFAVLALRGTGLGFVMITVALGQIVWGVAYRWLSITNGDNGITIKGRPSPFGLSLASPAAFYWATLIVFAAALLTMAIFVASPFGASLRGTGDQPRRMNALGYHVWMIRFLAILFSAFWSGVAGILYLYYNQFVSPHAVALTASAEALLMVISGGTGTLLGPIVGAALVVVVKNVASAYIERWNFVLGAIFVAIVVCMPEGLVPGTVRLTRWMAASLRPRPAARVVSPGEEGGR